MSNSTTRQAKNYLAAYLDRDALKKCLSGRKITVSGIFEYVATNRAVEKLFKDHDASASTEDKAKVVEKALKLPRPSFEQVKIRLKREGKTADVSAAVDEAAQCLVEAKAAKTTFDKASRYCRLGKILPKDLLNAAEVIITALKAPEEPVKGDRQLWFKFVTDSGEAWSPFYSPKSDGTNFQ